MSTEIQPSSSASLAPESDRMEPPVSPVVANLSDEELIVAIRKQLEYYFSKENLQQDAYLTSQMDGNMSVPITTIMTFAKIKTLTLDEAKIHRALENSTLSVIENGTRIKSNVKMSGRSTIILREISSDAPEEEVREIFNYEGCKPIVSMRSDIGDTWFVVFESEDDAKDTLLDLRLKKRTFRDQSVKGRVKSETIARSFYPLQPPPPIVFPNMQFPIMGGPNMIPGPFSPFMMVPGMVPGMMPGMVPGGMIPITLASPMGIMAPTFEGESGKIESTRSHDSNNADGTTTTSHSDHAEQAHQNQSGDSKNNRVNGKNGVPQNGVNTSASANKDANSAINRPKSVSKDAAVKDAKKVGATSSGVASGASTGANGANRSTGGANNSNSSNNNSKSRDRSGGNARKENSSSTTAVSKSLPIEISTINFPPLVSPPHTSEGETSSGRKSEDDTSTQHHLTESFAAAAAGHASHSKATESTTPQVSSTPNIVVTSTNTDTSPVIDVTFGDIDISATTMPVEVILPSTTAATSVSTSKGTSSWAALVKSSPGPTVEASAKPVPSSSSASTNSNTNKSSATKEKTTSTATAAEIKGGTSGNNSNNNDNKKEKRREKKTDSSHHKSSTSSSLSQNLSNLNLPKDGQLNFTGDSENNEDKHIDSTRSADSKDSKASATGASGWGGKPTFANILKLQQAAQTPDSTTGVTPSSTSNSTLVISKTLKPNATKSSSSDNKGTSEADKQAAGERRRNKSKMNGFATGSSDSSIDGTTWRVSTDKKATAGGGESDPSI